MAKIIMYKEDRYMDLVRAITGFEFDSALDVGERHFYTAYFKDGSEYNVQGVGSIITERKADGFAAKAYMILMQGRAKLVTAIARG